MAPGAHGAWTALAVGALLRTPCCFCFHGCRGQVNTPLGDNKHALSEQAGALAPSSYTLNLRLSERARLVFLSSAGQSLPSGEVLWDWDWLWVPGSCETEAVADRSLSSESRHARRAASQPEAGAGWAGAAASLGPRKGLLEAPL